MRKLIVSGLISLAIPILVSAQRPGGFPATGMSFAAPPAVHSMAAAHAPVARAIPGRPTVASRSATHSAAPGLRAPGPRKPAGFPVLPQPSPVPFPGNPGFNSGFGPGFFNEGGEIPVPGFGFDYEHFFAVHPHWGEFHHTAGVLLPFWGGGLYVPMPYYGEPQPQEQSAQETASAPSGPSQEAAQQDETASMRTHSNYYANAPAVPEYVFVKRDGSIFYAVAYSWTKDKLQYVTKDGLRRVATLDSLDLDATQKSNEDRGNTLTLPTLGPTHSA